MYRWRSRLQEAIEHLRSSDKVLRSVIDEVGPCTLRIERNRFAALVRAIVSQQISSGAARAIYRRLSDALAPAEITAIELSRCDSAGLMRLGLSNQKAEYVRDLALQCVEGNVELGNIGRFSDERVISQLTQVKGIGTWTAQMFLIFSLGRLNVFPARDFGIRSAMRNLYGLADLPDETTAEPIVACWRPYASVACWYCWRSFD